MAMRFFHAETRKTAEGMEYLWGWSGMEWQKICFTYQESFPY